MIGVERDSLRELAPLARRALSLDPGALVRVRSVDGRLSLLVRLPFGVLAARTIALERDGAKIDVTVRASELLEWLDVAGAAEPAARDTEWRSALPPAHGWHRVDTVPDSVVRELVRTGALTLQNAAVRDGVPGAQPRAAVADALLDSIVLTASDDAGRTASVALRTLSALTRLGFLPRDSHVALDSVGRWTRVAAEYGSVYAERPGFGLAVL